MGKALIDDNATATLEDPDSLVVVLDAVRANAAVMTSTATYSESYRPIPIASQRASRLLLSWIAEDEQGDAEEQHADWEELKRALEEDRLSARRLFK
jgi:hypothetical protein